MIGVGLAVGMMVGAAATAGAVLSCPQGRCMARKLMRQGKRYIVHMKYPG